QRLGERAAADVPVAEHEHAIEATLRQLGLAAHAPAQLVPRVVARVARADETRERAEPSGPVRSHARTLDTDARLGWRWTHRAWCRLRPPGRAPAPLLGPTPPRAVRFTDPAPIPPIESAPFSLSDFARNVILF